MNREISISLSDISNETQEFNSSSHLLTILSEESDFWKEQEESLSNTKIDAHSLIRSHTGFINCITKIESLCEDSDTEGSELSNKIREVLDNDLGKKWLWSSHPYSAVYVHCNRDFGYWAADAFINSVTNKGFDRKFLTDLQQRSSKFPGYVLACEYLRKDIDSYKRRNGEKVSLDRLRRQYEKIKEKLVVEFEGFKSEIESWGDETKTNWVVFMDQSAKAHSDQQDSHAFSFEELIKDGKSKLEKMEKLYKEKLRLEAPVTYWQEAADRYKCQGIGWVCLLLGSLCAGVYGFSKFFITWLEGRETMIQLDTVQGIILFGTILATFAFLVRILSRLTFSSFHLMRDAQERKQLTLVYLSLIKENKIDESSRDIILQALFSRTETGLLAGESRPAKPGLSADSLFNRHWTRPGDN